jgi:hypothetical protein
LGRQARVCFRASKGGCRAHVEREGISEGKRGAGVGVCVDVGVGAGVGGSGEGRAVCGVERV